MSINVKHLTDWLSLLSLVGWAGHVYRFRLEGPDLVLVFFLGAMVVALAFRPGNAAWQHCLEPLVCSSRMKLEAQSKKFGLKKSFVGRQEVCER
ncbi:hypothetical protein NDU88_002320 [Pleurodeles waltl]|uniref:Uncharacterized protein n=1 Tax=Pleurodeles waltl TaxID=8319 RepID=A0AAV7NDF0_PLEWA|nr:hypothetical protein NDU88_002320 [Pleurodeles waltl]